jgi:transcriptional regulator with XRE-family HTH domain
MVTNVNINNYMSKQLYNYICKTVILYMKERILKFLKAENKTSAQFAEEIGVQPSGVSHILSGRNKPSLDFVLKMLDKYSFLSTEWLLFGKGNMYRDSSMQNLFDQSAGKVEIGSDINKTVKGREPESSEYMETRKEPEIKAGKEELTVEKIVWFYNNNSFREYLPDKD